jgi:hypothetical protein
MHRLACPIIHHPQIAGDMLTRMKKEKPGNKWSRPGNLDLYPNYYPAIKIDCDNRLAFRN